MPGVYIYSYKVGSAWRLYWFHASTDILGRAVPVACMKAFYLLLTKDGQCLTTTDVQKWPIPGEVLVPDVY